MQTAGLVQRERSALDERSVTVLLTADGKALKDRASRVPVETFTATGLTVADLIDRCTRLNQLTGALDRSVGVKDDRRLSSPAERWVTPASDDRLRSKASDGQLYE